MCYPCTADTLSIIICAFDAGRMPPICNQYAIIYYSTVAACYQYAIKMLPMHYHYADSRVAACYQYAINMLSLRYRICTRFWLHAIKIYAKAMNDPAPRPLSKKTIELSTCCLWFNRMLLNCYTYAINILCPRLHATNIISICYSI